MTEAEQCEKKQACEGTHDGLAAVTISRLKARLNELEQQNTSLVADTNPLALQVAALQQSCNDGMAQLSQAKLSYKQQETALQDEVQQLKNQLADVRAAGDEASHQVEAARAEVHALLAARESSSQKLRAQAAQLQSQLTAKTTEAATLSRKLAASEPLADALELELRSLHQSLVKVTSRVHAQEAALKHHEKGLLETTRAGEKLADQLEAKGAAMQAAQQQLHDIKASSAAAEQAHQAAQRCLQEQLFAAQQQINAMAADHAACQAEQNGQLQGLQCNIKDLKAQLQEGAAYQETTAVECKELKTKLAAAEVAAAAAVSDATERCNAAVLAVVVLQQAHIELHNNADATIQAARHAAADARTAAGAAAAQGTAAKAAAEALQLVADEATAVAEAAEAKASAADRAAEAAKANATAAANRAATAEGDATAAMARLATAEAAANAAIAKAAAAEKELAAAKGEVTAIGTAHATALAQQQQSVAHFAGTGNQCSAVAVSVPAPPVHMPVEPASGVKQETTESSPPHTVAAVVRHAQPAVLSGRGLPDLLSGSKRTSPESAGTAATEQLQTSHELRIECRPASKKPAISSTLAAQNHHHNHQPQQHWQHSASSVGQQCSLQQLQQGSGVGAAVFAMNILNPLTQPQYKSHNASSHPIPRVNSASVCGNTWPTQQVRVHAAAGAGNQSLAPATSMLARHVPSHQQCLSYSQQQQQQIMSYSQQQLCASQEPSKPHWPQQHQQQLRPNLSQQQQHAASEELLNQQQLLYQFAWPQITQVQHAPALAAANIAGTKLPGDASAVANTVAHGRNNAAVEQQGASAQSMNTALPGRPVSNSKSPVAAGITVATCTDIHMSAVERNCSASGSMTAAASTTHKQYGQHHSADAVSKDFPTAVVAAAAAAAASVAAQGGVAARASRDAVAPSAADCPKPNLESGCPIVQIRQAEKVERVSAFTPSAATATVKREMAEAVISADPANQPAGDQKADSDQQHSVAAAVAEGVQQQQRAKSKKAAKPATAMGMLFCALADSGDESE